MDGEATGSRGDGEADDLRASARSQLVEVGRWRWWEGRRRYMDWRGRVMVVGDLDVDPPLMSGL